jgi:hypothetical protein
LQKVLNRVMEKALSASSLSADNFTCRLHT